MSKTIYKNDPYRRNLQVIKVSPEMLEMLLFRKKDMVLISNLPEDTVIVRMLWCDETNTFDIVVKHESFPELEEGCMIPRTNNALTLYSSKAEYNEHLLRKLKE